MKPFHPMGLILTGLLASAALAAPPAEDSGLARYKPLIARNPFMPPKSEVANLATRPSATAPYRFTGFLTIGKKTLIAVENAAENKSLLLTPGQNMDGLEVKEMDPKARTITLLANGETMRLEMLDVAAGVPPAPPGVPGVLPAAMAAGGAAPPPELGSTNAPRRRIIIVPRRKAQ